MSGKNKNKQRKDDPRKWTSGLRYGRGVSIRFFHQNLWLLVLIIVVVLVLIGLRYRTKTRMMEIKQLTTELEHAENYKLEQKAAYMSLIRESEMKRLVTEKNLNLEFQQTPPYEVHADE